MESAASGAAVPLLLLGLLVLLAALGSPGARPFRLPLSLLLPAPSHSVPATAATADGAVPVLADPTPGSAAGEIKAALRNLSLAACEGQAPALLSLIGDNVTVLAVGSTPQVLVDRADVVGFFASSFLPCGTRFLIADLALGKGAPVPEPVAPVPPEQQPRADSAPSLAEGRAGAAPKFTGSGGESINAGGESAVSGGGLTYAVTHLAYIDYSSGDVGKALALWTLAGKTKVGRKERNLWNLTVIGWSSDLPAGNASSPESPPLLLRGPMGLPSSSSWGGGGGLGLRSALGSEGLALPLRARRALSAATGEATPATSPYPAALRGGGSVALWAALNDTLGWFSANVTAGNVENASRLFTSAHSYWYLEPGVPPEEYATPADRLGFVELFLGLRFEFRVQALWELELKEPGAGSNGKLPTNAVSIMRVAGVLPNGTAAVYGHSLVLWETNTITPSPTPTASALDLRTTRAVHVQGAKIEQYALRWELFIPCSPLLVAP